MTGLPPRSGGFVKEPKHLRSGIWRRSEAGAGSQRPSRRKPSNVCLRAEAERTSQGFEQRVSQRAYFLWREAGKPDGRAEEFWADAVKQDALGDPPAMDIAAVLTVIKRRREPSRDRL
jgi:hypothetical protein